MATKAGCVAACTSSALAVRAVIGRSTFNVGEIGASAVWGSGWVRPRHRWQRPALLTVTVPVARPASFRTVPLE
jgi:hypothetical protein